MTEYEAGLPVAVAFPPEEARSLAQAFSEAGWRQFHVAETEKYAHVTYFFNGGVEAPYPGRGAAARSRAPGSRPTTSQPEMSAVGRHRRAGRGDRLGALRLHRRELRQPRHGRPHRRLGRDAGGARGRRRAAWPASSPRSRRSRPPIPTRPGALLAITADHGNADELRDADGRPGDRPLAQPGPVRARRSRGRGVDASPTASWPTSRRPCSSFAGLPPLGRG